MDENRDRVDQDAFRSADYSTRSDEGSLESSNDEATGLASDRDDKDEEVAGSGIGVVGGAAAGAVIGGPVGAVAGAVLGGVGGAAAGGAADEANKGGGDSDMDHGRSLDDATLDRRS
jgi:hypothetical protein